MNELTKIFEGQQLRIIDQNNETWFVAKDACEILEIKNPTQALQRLDDDERSMFNIGRQGNVNVVNEFGLYNLVLGSRKAEAKRFKRWVTHDVIPSIRQTGKYEMGNASYTIEDPIKRAERWIEEQKEKLMLEQRVKEYEPKVSYVDKILESKDSVNITQIAKDYGLSGQKLNQILHEDKVQYKMNGQWLLYGKHQQEGYTKSKTTEYKKHDGSTGTKLHTRWTQKGRLFIHEILKKRGIYPLLERNQMNHVG
ncbi:Prophage antirepressor [Gracilibacillus orientalis]|uniref:Prophage antirepressor n=1 Tax=Gracilibacillus orientalis TaxID=334253 RepID=A0A1I4HB29_9BACI|nr:phage antirepressor KilAC domain-containing protein [Gracilibacillus orientalis]SFL39492.1 Prophage antirepressor [Gracilibacillus orientalis]